MTAAPSTVEALTFCLRTRGPNALAEHDTRRLAELDREQTVDVAVRLQKLKPEIAAPWNENQIGKLFEARAAL
jgi:hypothetical protein